MLLTLAETSEVARLPLRELLDLLDPEAFWQVRRGTIVNRRHVLRAVRDELGIWDNQTRCDRVKGRSGQYRMFYLKKFAEGILVLHAFMKKSRETPKSAIELAQRRLKGMQRERS